MSAKVLYNTYKRWKTYLYIALILHKYRTELGLLARTLGIFYPKDYSITYGRVKGKEVRTAISPGSVDLTRVLQRHTRWNSASQEK